MDIGGYEEFSTEKKNRIWMDMDPAERGGVEWVSEFCPVKGSRRHYQIFEKSYRYFRYLG